jgi:hypothetical protein
MNFNGAACKSEEYSAQYYERFLRHVQATHGGQYWHVLPRDLARFWMRTVRDHEHDARALRSLQDKNTGVRREAGTIEGSNRAGACGHE